MHKNYGLWILVLLSGILAFMLLSTYWQYLAFAVIFAVLFAKWNRKLARKVGPNTAALLITLAVVLLIVVPTIYIIVSAINQVPSAYSNAFNALGEQQVRGVFGYSSDQVSEGLVLAGENIRAWVLRNAADFLNQLTNLLVGMVLMFLTLFFLLRDGDDMYEYLLHTLPVRKHNTMQFAEKLKAIVNGLFIGQLATAAIQGTLFGILIAILGVPNALLLAVLTILLSIIPLLGPFLVYIPVAVYLFIIGSYIKAAILLAFGVLILSQIDNVVRPYVANKSSAIHPLTVIVGAIAGIKLWGLIGFILGPLVLAGFFALYEFSMTGNEDVLQKRSVREAQRKQESTFIDPTRTKQK